MQPRSYRSPERLTMPCYLLTYHGHGTWMPDHPRGYVRRKEGALLSDSNMARCYRKNLQSNAVHFHPALQQRLLDSILATRPFLGIRVHCIACEVTHVHILLSWGSERNVRSINKSMKDRLTRQLNQEFVHRRWLSKGSSCKRVRDRNHFDHLMENYLPRHQGLVWRSSEE